MNNFPFVFPLLTGEITPTHTSGAMLVTAWFILTVILVAGVMLHVGLGWIHIDVARRIYDFLDVSSSVVTLPNPTPFLSYLDSSLI